MKINNTIKNTMLLLAVLAGFTPEVLAAPPFTITCRTFNATTLQRQTTFHPGDDVLVILKPTFPDNRANNKEMTVTATAKVKIAGIQLPYKLNSGSSLPNTNPISSPRTGLLQSGEERRIFQIPKESPSATASLTIVATIKGIGSASCARTILVVP